MGEVLIISWKDKLHDVIAYAYNINLLAHSLLRKKKF